MPNDVYEYNKIEYTALNKWNVVWRIKYLNHLNSRSLNDELLFYYDMYNSQLN